MKGGYKMVSLKDFNFIPDTNETTIPGIYEAIEGNHRKAILLVDLIISDIERAERYVEFGVENSDWVAFLTLTSTTTYQIRITADDTVSIVNY